MKKLALLSVPVLAMAVWLWGSAAPPEDLDPLKVAADTHKLLYENKLVRVIVAKVPPGKVEPKHSHPNGVTVYLADYVIENKAFPSGKVARHERKFGTVSWSDALVHEVKNVGRTESHSIRVELKY